MKDSGLQENKDNWLHIRVTKKEYDIIHAKFKKTTCRKLSEYVRRVLLDKPITVTTRDKSLDDFMAEMMKLRKELHFIGHNYNQAVKKLHTLDYIQEFHDWTVSYESLRDIFLRKTDEIKERINQFSDQWLQ